MVVESYSENNMTTGMIGRNIDHYWLGLSSLDDLRTDTLESAAGMLVSQYAGILNIFIRKNFLYFLLNKNKRKKNDVSNIYK